MNLQAGTHKLGPDNASLTVKTYREGVAAKVGHDLIIEVQQWEATLELAADEAQSRLELSADPASLHPREGVGGVKPLTDKDRNDIRGNITGKVLGNDPIGFRSTAVEGGQAGGRLSVQGELTINGETRPASFEVEVGTDGRATGTTELVQSEWGIKPYRGLMGALKVRDSVEIVFEGKLAAA
jgi:polyisoprenoid-binding protein YceI